MECNREEALRAKGIAEKKMESKDFSGARKIAIKAQNLYPGLENISQLIMVCEVHCSAENKILGTEMDWYGILKLEPTADDALIRKQFRKFALGLHPDKNKFAGAADAFKLIGEAQRLLLDQQKRKIHDEKRKFAVVSGAPKQANRPSKVQRPPRDENNSANANKQFQQGPQTVQTGSNTYRPTFWTACPFCYIRYQYYRDVLHRNLCCQSCGKAFTAYEVDGQGVAPQNSSSQSAFPKQTGDHNQASCKVGTRSNAEYTTKVEVGGNTWSSEVAQGSKPNENCGDVSMNCNQKRKAEIPQPCGKMNEKKRKQVFESSKHCHSEASTKSEEEVPIKGGEFYCKPSPRRPSRLNRNASNTDNVNDYNDTVEPTEGNKCRYSSHSSRDEVEDVLPKQEPPATNGSTGIEEDQKLQSDASGNTFENPTEDAGVSEDSSEEAYEIPEPEFYNFDANKSLEKFEVDQVWALYCDEDALPKYYGCIKKIDQLPEYKLHVAWLTVGSKPKGMIQWIDKKVPITCGRFKLRKMRQSEYTSTASFSHQVKVRVESSGKKEEYVILPRKGEIWALYRSWNPGLKCSDLENCVYEIVEVVEENKSGISVLSLEEVDGYKSVFRAQVKGQDPVTFKIPANELLRFSHQIPAFRLTEEQGGSLRGCLELDPAGFPFHWFCKD